MILILSLLRRVNVRGKVLKKINHKLGIRTNLRTKGIKIISFHIVLNVIMPIIYRWFNTFIDFPVFSILLDPLDEIPLFFDASCLKYPARGGIQHLLILTRKPGIKICNYNIFGEFMDRTFEHYGFKSPPSLSDALSVARPKLVDVIPVSMNFMKRVKLCIKERHKLFPIKYM